MAGYFTLESANEALKIVKPLVTQVMEIRQEILDKQPEAWPAVEKAAGNGGNRSAGEIALHFSRLEALIEAIQASGAVIKDINSGLIDFLALREGREVYLCWKFGEEEIRYWHELDAGFSGRQPV